MARCRGEGGAGTELLCVVLLSENPKGLIWSTVKNEIGVQRV